MHAEVIAIGDELLIGQTVNTNASWIGQELALIGIKVKYQQVVSDNEEDIIAAIDLAFNRSELILVTGGLGPTKDDITKKVLCDFFKTSLVLNQEVLSRVEDFFSKRNRPMLEVNIQQAYLPKDCQVIHNHLGTASGMWFEKEGKVLVSMPGVPYEMKGLMERELLERFKAFFKTKNLFHETLLTTGIGESFLADKIAKIETELLEEGFSLAYLPSPGLVKLRITSFEGEKDKDRIVHYFERIQKEIPDNWFAFGDSSLSQVVGRLLIDSKQTVGTVESCTGGGLATEITAVPGASNYYSGSLITYSNEQKNRLLNVPLELLEKYSAVSEEVAREMAQNGKTKLNVDFCLATTGIAGPDGGSELTPVGTIFIALATPTKVIVKRLNLGDSRERNSKMTILAALNLLRLELHVKNL